MGEEFNTDKFIDEIQKRPAIWDMTNSEYSNKIIKKNAWEEIVLIFCHNEDTDEKKKILGTSLQKKWKSIRDHYVKQDKKNKMLKSGSGAKPTSTYIHYNRLRFLQNSVQKNVTESNFGPEVHAELPISEVENGSVQNSSLEATVSTPTGERQKTKKLKLHPADQHFANILEKSLAQRQVPDKQDEQDEDKLFCLSLFKEIKKIPENKRLKTKIDIYNLILQKQTPEPEKIFPSTSNYMSSAPPLPRYSIPHTQQYCPAIPSSQPSYTPGRGTYTSYNDSIFSPSNEQLQDMSMTSPASTVATYSSQESELDLFIDN
ncbi:uncharacterized protein [Diabrotica undecimpunctata]|uniref:uncharacterized protein n=1 Tax=Diabrotica undecimpunctata TaxID=50387 RepID=UPI003B634686